MGKASRRGTYEERKAAAIARQQAEWNERIERVVEEQYAEHCTANPQMTEEERKALREGLVLLTASLQKTPAPKVRK